MNTVASLFSALAVIVLLVSGLPAHAQAFLENTQTAERPTWLEPDNSSKSLPANAQGTSSTNGQLTGTQATYSPLTIAVARKLRLPKAPAKAGSNNLLAPNSVDPTPIPSESYTYGFPVAFPPIPGGIYQGQDAYLPPTSTASVDLNIVDFGGTQYPLVDNFMWFITDPNHPGPHPNVYDPRYDTKADLLETKAEGMKFLKTEFGL